MHSPRWTFDRWKAEVDAQLFLLSGETSNGLPDMPWHDWYTARVGPKRAALRALKLTPSYL